MRLPSRVTPYRNSTLARFPVVLSLLKESGHMTPRALYQLTKSKSFGVAEFIEVLDCLYLLGRIDFDKEKEVLCYVDGGQM